MRFLIVTALVACTVDVLARAMTRWWIVANFEELLRDAADAGRPGPQT